jgi:hypothetical protein
MWLNVRRIRTGDGKNAAGTSPCQEIGARTMSATHADAPFLRRVLVVLVMATVLSGTISGVGAFRLSQANAEASTFVHEK